MTQLGLGHRSIVVIDHSVFEIDRIIGSSAHGKVQDCYQNCYQKVQNAENVARKQQIDDVTCQIKLLFRE